MVVDLPSFDQIMSALGYVLVILLAVVLIFSLFMVLLTLVSMRRGRFYLPWLLRPGLIVLEGVIKIIWRIGKIDDNELTAFTIRLRNQLNQERFRQVPMEKRLIFLPQCLRSAECPASLTTEGLVCIRCKRCDIGRSIDELEAQRCKVFIVPGSTFVVRLIKKYRPEAIVGVGCLMEVKEGLEMAERIDLLAMGVITSKDGCVETLLEWSRLMDVASLQPSNKD